MQIETLKIFCDVAKYHSFSRGATENQISQSAASQAIFQVEERLGIKLIDRSCRPLKLTSEGEVFCEGARQVVDHYTELENQIKSLHHELTSKIRVACIYSVGLSHIKEFAEEFSKLYPKVQIQIECLHPDKVYENILKEEADLGIVSFPQPRQHLAIIPWTQEPMVVVCHPQHFLAKSKEIVPSQMMNEKFVGFDNDLTIRKEVDRFLKKHHTDVRIELEFDNIEAIKRAVEINTGISILPQPTLERELKAGTIAAIPLTTRDFVRPLGIIHRRGKKFSPPMIDFVELLLQESTVQKKGSLSKIKKKSKNASKEKFAL